MATHQLLIVMMYYHEYYWLHLVLPWLLAPATFIPSTIIHIRVRVMLWFVSNLSIPCRILRRYRRQGESEMIPLNNTEYVHNLHPT